MPVVRDTKMIKEHDRVVLTKSVPPEALEEGDVGTVIHAYKDREAYEAEFLTLDGRTAAVATLESSYVRAVSPRDITHPRELSVASLFGNSTIAKINDQLRLIESLARDSFGCLS